MDLECRETNRQLPINHGAMETNMPVPRYAHGAIGFLIHYIRRRILSHSVVIAAVVAAVTCAVASQYAVKNLVDVLGTHDPDAAEPR